MLTGESWFYISTPLGIEPRSLMMGSKWVDHWTSGPVELCMNAVRLQALWRVPPQQPTCQLWSQKEDLRRGWNRDRRASDNLVTVRDKGCLRRGHNDQSHQGHQCSETALTGGSRFYISTPLGNEPGCLMMGSKRVDHWTSGTAYECSSEIAGSPLHLILLAMAQ